MAMHYDYETCDEPDCQLCLGIKAKQPAKDAGKPSIIEELSDLIVIAVTRLNDKIDANKSAPVDLSALQSQLDNQAQINQDNLNDLVTAITAKLGALPAGDTSAIMNAIEAERNSEQAKLDALVMAIDAKIAAIPAADPAETQGYADAGDAETLTDAQTYTDQTAEQLADQIATAHDELVQLIIDHAVPAATIAAAAKFDPQLLVDLRKDLSDIIKAGDTALGLRINTAVNGLAHDVSVFAIVKDAPAAAKEDEVYIVDPTPTGTFVGHANEIAQKVSGAWTFSAPRNQETHLLESDNTLRSWNGTAWVKVGTVQANSVSGSVAGVAAPLTLWTGSKAQYDAITTKDPATVYAVKP